MIGEEAHDELCRAESRGPEDTSDPPRSVAQPEGPPDILVAAERLLDLFDPNDRGTRDMVGPDLDYAKAAIDLERQRRSSPAPSAAESVTLREAIEAVEWAADHSDTFKQIKGLRNAAELLRAARTAAGPAAQDDSA